MTTRPVHRHTLGLAASLVLLVVPAACGGSSTDGDPPSTLARPAARPTTTARPTALPPTMLDASRTSATVAFGTVVVLDLGDPSPGRFVATSSDPTVFEVTSTGGSQGTYTSNAGGRAVGPGTAKVTVRLEGTPADPAVAAAPLPTFTVTVEQP